MPVTKSATKRARRDQQHYKVNQLTRRKLKDKVKEVRDLIIKSKDVANAKKILPLAYKQIDFAVKKHLLYKNTAARKKSLLARMINKAEEK